MPWKKVAMVLEDIIKLGLREQHLNLPNTDISKQKTHATASTVQLMVNQSQERFSIEFGVGDVGGLLHSFKAWTRRRGTSKRIAISYISA